MALESKHHLDAETKKNVDNWLEGQFDQETKDEIQRLLDQNPQELTDAFYTKLAFGTGGLRGVMGVGTNRMNKYTIRAATQGLANYLNRQVTTNPSVIIGFDSRHNSPFFAKETARVLAANGIKVYLFEELRSTPLVSFGCRYKKCNAAIVVTASHNPPEYNGYKVYWDDGAQVLPPHDRGIVKEANSIQDPSRVKISSFPHQLIELVGSEIDKAYLQATNSLQHYPKENCEFGSSLKIVYTNLHGTGSTVVPSILKKWGFTNITSVEEQLEPDGDFPTVKQPNPEDAAAMELGVKKLQETNGNLLLGTDPDTDRVGAIVLHNGAPYYFNGNQIACICLYHICEALTSQNAMPENGAFIKTIVTSELFREIAKGFNKPCFDVLTGFKYIAEMIRSWEEQSDGYHYLFGGEESYGYLLGTHARDKDAAISCALIAEAALHAKKQNKTLVDTLFEIYSRFGVFKEDLLSINFPEGKESRDKMQQMMHGLRESPPRKILDKSVLTLEDYQASIKLDLLTGEKTPLTLPTSNVLLFWLDDGSKLAIRPSGTEPKVKVYVGTQVKEFSTVEEGITTCDKKATALLREIKALIEQ